MTGTTYRRTPLPSGKPPDHPLDRLLAGVDHQFEIDTDAKGTINPFALFAVDSDACMGLAQQAAMVNLRDDDLALAKAIGLRVAESQTPSIRALVEAWEQAPSLVDFSAAVARAMLPDYSRNT